MLLVPRIWHSPCPRHLQDHPLLFTLVARFTVVLLRHDPDPLCCGVTPHLRPFSAPTSCRVTQSRLAHLFLVYSLSCTTDKAPGGWRPHLSCSLLCPGALMESGSVTKEHMRRDPVNKGLLLITIWILRRVQHAHLMTHPSPLASANRVAL